MIVVASKDVKQRWSGSAAPPHGARGGILGEREESLTSMESDETAVRGKHFIPGNMHRFRDLKKNGTSKHLFFRSPFAQ